MRIISCHIENFGKLSDVTYEFEKGINCIFEANGYGKSTLATFIKVMFFGFAGENKKDDMANERRRYSPWQGGIYGGQLTFETNGKCYQIIRTFGTKTKEDTFLIIDDASKLASSDFTDNIGQELFEIDHDSFCRSIYIAASDCETLSTDSIHSKLGNLADSTDDINNYETAKKKLADMLNKLSPDRKTGKLYKEQEQAMALKESVRGKQAVIDAMAETKKLESEAKAVLEEKEEELKVIDSEITKLASTTSVVKREMEYKQLLSRVTATKKELEGYSDYFGESFPTEEVLREAQQLCQKAMDKTNGLSGKKNTLDSLEKQSEGTGSVNKSLIIGLLLMAFGCLLLRSSLDIAMFFGIIIVTVGSVIAVYGLVSKRKNTNVSEILELRDEVSNDQQYISESRQEIIAFFDKYLRGGFRNEFNDVDNIAIENFWTVFYIKIFEKINRMSFILSNIKKSNEKLEECKKELLLFEANNDISQIEAAAFKTDGNLLVDKRTVILEEIEAVKKDITGYEARIKKLTEDLEQIQSDEVELEGLLGLIREDEENYKIIALTEQYLDKAKESFSGRYSSSIMNGFIKYYSLLTNDADKDKYMVDTNLNVSLLDKGNVRDVKALSSGYRHLVGICMRMALVEGMYKEEKPFVVLDDPFVFLDDERSKYAKELLENIAKDYQVIYFTCHKSRAY